MTSKSEYEKSTEDVFLIAEDIATLLKAARDNVMKMSEAVETLVNATATAAGKLPELQRLLKKLVNQLNKMCDVKDQALECSIDRLKHWRLSIEEASPTATRDNLTKILEKTAKNCSGDCFEQFDQLVDDLSKKLQDLVGSMDKAKVHTETHSSATVGGLIGLASSSLIGFLWKSGSHCGPAKSLVIAGTKVPGLGVVALAVGVGAVIGYLVYKGMKKYNEHLTSKAMDSVDKAQKQLNDIVNKLDQLSSKSTAAQTRMEKAKMVVIHASEDAGLAAPGDTKFLLRTIDKCLKALNKDVANQQQTNYSKQTQQFATGCAQRLEAALSTARQYNCNACLAPPV